MFRDNVDFCFRVKMLIGLDPFLWVVHELRKRGVQVEKLHGLDVFGGGAADTTRAHAASVGSIEVWEVRTSLEAQLRRNLPPRAVVKIVDSYEEARQTDKRFDLIVVDNWPGIDHTGHCEHFDILPLVFRLAKDEAIVILNILTHLDKHFTRVQVNPPLFCEEHLRRRREFYGVDQPEDIPIEKMIETYQSTAARNGYRINWYFAKRRFALRHPFASGLKYLAAKIVRTQDVFARPDASA